MSPYCPSRRQQRTAAHIFPHHVICRLTVVMTRKHAKERTFKPNRLQPSSGSEIRPYPVSPPTKTDGLATAPPTVPPDRIVRQRLRTVHRKIQHMGRCPKPVHCLMRHGPAAPVLKPAACIGRHRIYRPPRTAGSQTSTWTVAPVSGTGPIQSQTSCPRAATAAAYRPPRLRRRTAAM